MAYANNWFAMGQVRVEAKMISLPSWALVRLCLMDEFLSVFRRGTLRLLFEKFTKIERIDKTDLLRDFRDG